MGKTILKFTIRTVIETFPQDIPLIYTDWKITVSMPKIAAYSRIVRLVEKISFTKMRDEKANTRPLKNKASLVVLILLFANSPWKVTFAVARRHKDKINIMFI